MSTTLRLKACAKLNLYLRVLGKRPDGYHELETLFERISLADELSFEASSRDVVLTCNRMDLSCGEDNLVIKAARLLQRKTNTAKGAAKGARIRLIKRIPIAAGLGGGSSDAATTLLGLNQLWGLGLKPPLLRELGAQLGADVAFFLYNAPYALGTGRGDICEALACRQRLAHVLVVPDAHLSTADVFRTARFKLTANKPSIRIAQHALSNGSLGELASGLTNDLEPEAIRRCPVIATIRKRLTQLGCLATRMSGSGPAVFGLCRDLEQATQVVSTLRQQTTQAWLIDIIETAV